MRLAAVDANSAAPDGGEILKDEQGRPIGVFRETAQGLVGMAMARDERQRTVAERRALTYRAVELAGQECLRHGITSFQDAGSTFSEIRMFRELALDQKLPLRLYVMVRDSNEGLRKELPQLKAIGVGQDFFTCRSIKRSIDGALGPHGAWLLAPYNDLPTSSGLNTASVESVRETAEIAAELDFQLCVHAIGDRANRETLNIFEEAFRSHPTNRSRRWRVEHAQHLAPNDIKRFSELDVIASMQGVHCTSDAIFVLQRLGMARAESGAYVWRSLLDSGAIVTNGTDAPVESVDPFPSLAASITRELADGSTFFPEQCMTREEALRSYTIDCAYAAFEETLKGSLVPGKLADLVILDRNLLTCPPHEIATTQVVKTILAGKVVYERDAVDNK
jgi:predicted amidohydrolase YtcJ